jgi:hypothetical protein
MIGSLILAMVLSQCDEGYVASAYAGQARQQVWQPINIQGGERTRSYTTANVDGKNYLIPVINGKLPCIAHVVSDHEDRLVLDYSQNYPYTVAYRGGIVYNCAAAVANHKSGPSAVKNFDGQNQAKKANKKAGPSGLKTPDALQKEVKKTTDLPGPVATPVHPSDKEIDDLLK